MKKNLKLDYKKHMSLCKLLGAEKFQNIIFKVENIKWNIISHIIPNFIDKYDKYYDYQMKKELVKASKEDIYNIKEKYFYKKMIIRNEYNNKQNINYHLNKNKPPKFIKYLENNKKIHLKGINRNILNYIILSIFFIISKNIIIIPLLILNTFSTFINFECINIQNYNLYRFKYCEKYLYKQEEKKYYENKQNNKNLLKIISNYLKQEMNLNNQNIVNIPTTKEVLNRVTTIDELQQFKSILNSLSKDYKEIEKEKSLHI